MSQETLRASGICGVVVAKKGVDGEHTCIRSIGHGAGVHEVVEIARDVIAYKTRSHVGAARDLSIYVVERAAKLEEIAVLAAMVFEEKDLLENDQLAQIRVYECFAAIMDIVHTLG